MCGAWTKPCGKKTHTILYKKGTPHKPSGTVLRTLKNHRQTLNTCVFGHTALSTLHVRPDARPQVRPQGAGLPDAEDRRGAQGLWRAVRLASFVVVSEHFKSAFLHGYRRRLKSPLVAVGHRILTQRSQARHGKIVSSRAHVSQQPGPPEGSSLGLLPQVRWATQRVLLGADHEDRVLHLVDKGQESYAREGPS